MKAENHSGMSHSTIATFSNNKNKEIEVVKRSASLKTTKLTKIQEEPVSDMEKLLMTWMEDPTQKQIFLNPVMITAKAKRLFAMLKEKAGPDHNGECTSSSG